jgi:hypothetical protein
LTEIALREADPLPAALALLEAAADAGREAALARPLAAFAENENRKQEAASTAPLPAQQPAQPAAEGGAEAVLARLRQRLTAPPKLRTTTLASLLRAMSSAGLERGAVAFVLLLVTHRSSLASSNLATLASLSSRLARGSDAAAAVPAALVFAAWRQASLQLGQQAANSSVESRAAAEQLLLALTRLLAPAGEALDASSAVYALHDTLGLADRLGVGSATLSAEVLGAMCRVEYARLGAALESPAPTAPQLAPLSRALRFCYRKTRGARGAEHAANSSVLMAILRVLALMRDHGGVMASLGALLQRQKRMEAAPALLFFADALDALARPAWNPLLARGATGASPAPRSVDTHRQLIDAAASRRAPPEWYVNTLPAALRLMAHAGDIEAGEALWQKHGKVQGEAEAPWEALARLYAWNSRSAEALEALAHASRPSMVVTRDAVAAVFVDPRAGDAVRHAAADFAHASGYLASDFLRAAAEDPLASEWETPLAQLHSWGGAVDPSPSQPLPEAARSALRTLAEAARRAQ